MKKIIFYMLILLCNSATAQNWNWKTELRATIAPTALSTIAGSAWGVHEALQYRKTVFFRRFPRANRQYWDPEISWENKQWRHVPVQLSDAKHLFASVEKYALFASGITCTIPISQKWKKNAWKQNIARIALQSVATSFGYYIGNELTFAQFFKP